MFDHPQVLAEQMIGTIHHPLIGPDRGVTRPIKFGRTPGPEPFAAPTFGQDGASVLAGVGCTANELQALRAKGALL